MNSHARLTAWRHKEDLLELRSLFYPNNSPPQTINLSQEHHTSIIKAISQVHLYSSRARIPHTLQSTAHLFAVLLIMNDDSSSDTSRLSASMALIRFVNGLLDPGQQSQYAIPLQVLAKKISLPSVFVEFRHAATHEGMPSFEMCERCTLGALEWLYSHYWNDIEAKIDVGDDEAEQERLKQVEKKEVDQLVTLWKQYRRVRRRDINKVVKPGDTTEIGREYWGCVHVLESKMTHENEWWKLTYEVMVQRISSAKASFEQLKKLYDPVINYSISNLQDEFIISLIDTLLGMCYEYTKFKGLDMTKGFVSDLEWKHAKQWCQWLILDKLDEHSDVTIGKIIDTVGKKPDEFHLDLLKRLRSKLTNMDLIIQTDSKITSLHNVLSESQSKRFNNADDILGDLEILKRRKLEVKPNVIKLFEKHPNWEPKPFGILP